MSLILDALKRLEAKAPPRPAAAITSPVVEPPVAIIAEEPQPQVLLEEPEPVSLESVITADSPANDAFERSETFCNGPDLSHHDVDVQIAIGALEGDVRDLDLVIKALDEAEKQPPEETSAPAIETDAARHEPIIELAAEDTTADSDDLDTIDFAAELANLWDVTEGEPPNAVEPVAPVSEEPAAAEMISFGPLDEEALAPSVAPPSVTPPVESVAETEVAEAPDGMGHEPLAQQPTAPELSEPEAERQEITESADDTEAAEAEPPAGSILPMTDFRPAVAESPREVAPDDHDQLSAQLEQLEYRGLRDNVVSQLPDAPVALLFAAPDDDTNVVDVVVHLGDALAQLAWGDAVLVCSKEVRDAYRASPEYVAYQPSVRGGVGARRLPTLMIDPADASDRLVADLKRRCRWILFAADPNTAHRWAPLCDATYVVVALGTTDGHRAVKSVTGLELSGGHVLGCVLTDVPDVA